MIRNLLIGAIAAAALPANAQDSSPQRPALEFYRFDEDWRVLCAHPELRTEALDSAKCVTLADDVTLTFGGELRERLESVNNPDFGLGGPDDTALMHRALVHGDIRWGDRARVFLELGFYDVTGRAGGPNPTDRDRLDLAQAFVDLSGDLGAGRGTARIGRQELAFGSSRLVSVRESPNARRSFDAIHGFWEGNGLKADVFYGEPVTTKPGTFDDARDRSQALYGIYLTAPLTSALNADLYWLGFRDDNGRYASIAGEERRQSVGARLFGAADGWDWNFEGVYQFGTIGGLDISAWTLASDTGYTFGDVAWSPRVGLRADIASGDGDPADGKLGTFNALFPKFPYFSEANLVSPSNLIDLHPTLTLSPRRDFTIGFEADFLWRHRRADAVYGAPLAPYPGTAGLADRFIGTQLIVNADWQATEHLGLSASYVHFIPGDGMRSIGGKAGDFVFVSAAYKF